MLSGCALEGASNLGRVCSTEPFIEPRGSLPSESFASVCIVLPVTRGLFVFLPFSGALTCSASSDLWNKDSLVKSLAVKLEMKGKESWRGGVMQTMHHTNITFALDMLVVMVVTWDH